MTRLLHACRRFLARPRRPSRLFCTVLVAALSSLISTTTAHTQEPLLQVFHFQKLSQADGTVSFKNQQALFTGKVKNDSPGGITSGSVTAILRMESNGQIIAVGSAHLGITDSAAPGQILYYSITVPLPPKMDPALLETEIFARGYQP